MSRPRRRPYTEIGISRVPCARCGEPSSQQWTICSLGGAFHGICTGCDVALNALVLRFLRVPRREALLRAYRERMRTAA